MTKDIHHVCILQCDDVLDKFRTQYGNYPEMVELCLSSAKTGLSFDTFDVRKGCYPEVLGNYDFFVITGSKASVYDEDEWIGTLVDYVQLLEESSTPVFGICFGHQIMALANGCRVEKSQNGWGVGIASNKVTVEGLDIGLDSKPLNMIVSHQDQILEVKGVAKVLATSDFCKYFAVKWSDTSLSIQGHPEWVKEYSHDLMDDRRDRIPAGVISKGMDSLAMPLDNKGFLIKVLDFLVGKQGF